jgi:hypothetical protein
MGLQGTKQNERTKLGDIVFFNLSTEKKKDPSILKKKYAKQNKNTWYFTTN